MKDKKLAHARQSAPPCYSDSFCKNPRPQQGVFGDEEIITAVLSELGIHLI